MNETFPAVGRRYLVDFKQFRVELFFESITSMTYTGVKPDGTRGASETVVIAVNAIRDGLFLVTWTEGDGTIVVHLEDYELNTIITNIANPDHTLDRYEGTMTLLH